MYATTFIQYISPIHYCYGHYSFSFTFLFVTCYTSFFVLFYCQRGSTRSLRLYNLKSEKISKNWQSVVCRVWGSIFNLVRKSFRFNQHIEKKKHCRPRNASNNNKATSYFIEQRPFDFTSKNLKVAEDEGMFAVFQIVIAMKCQNIKIIKQI